MRLRSVVAAVATLGCAFASPATASGSRALTAARPVIEWDGFVSAPFLDAQVIDENGMILSPDPHACDKTTCDVTTLHLSVPKGRTEGEMHAVFELPLTLNATINVYDEQWAYVAGTDSTFALFPDTTPTTWPMTYELPIDLWRLRAGTYTVVVFDQGGSGQFHATVRWKPLPPPRRRHA